MKRRSIIIISGTVVVLLVAAFITFKLLPVQGNFPSTFSDADKREIVSLVRRDAYHRGVMSLIHGDFKSSWQWMRIARKQRVWSIGNQPNGDIWIHLGVEEPFVSDGYLLSARYFMRKQNGHWKLGTLF